LRRQFAQAHHFALFSFLLCSLAAATTNGVNKSPPSSGGPGAAAPARNTNQRPGVEELYDIPIGAPTCRGSSPRSSFTWSLLSDTKKKQLNFYVVFYFKTLTSLVIYDFGFFSFTWSYIPFFLEIVCWNSKFWISASRCYDG
jgi:hypothetical protein